MPSLAEALQLCSATEGTGPGVTGHPSWLGMSYSYLPGWAGAVQYHWYGPWWGKGNTPNWAQNWGGRDSAHEHQSPPTEVLRMPKASDSSATVLREDNYNVFTVLVWIMITMATRLMITAYFILFRLIRFANKYLTPYRRFFPFLLTSLSVTFISHTYLSKKKQKKEKTNFTSNILSR